MLSFKNYQKFGVEIEFYGIEDYLTRENVKLHLEKKGYLGKGWIVKPEEDMDCNVGPAYRGEITSPILTNSLEDLKDLKNVLEETKNLGARSNQRCGAHIHFDAERLTHDNVRFLQNLLLLHMCYEEIIFKFAAGKMENIRKSVNSHASPLIEQMSYYDLKRFIYEDVDYDDFYHIFIDGASRNASLNLSNLRNGGLNTIEFRIPDGTLDEFIWFNNINVFGLMIDHAIKMDSNERDYLYKETLKRKELGFDPEFTNVDRAKEFINLIKRCETDEISFLKQYQKKF